MSRLIIYIWLFCLPAMSAAQQGKFTIFDTIQIEEIRIAASVPLNQRMALDFHQSANFSSIDRINERLAGIMLIRRGAYAMDPQMHGFAAGQINVTIDGMRMFGACTDRMDPVTSYLEPDNLKSLIINQGTRGNSNGNTVGGSYEMILKEPMTGGEPLSIAAGTGYESVSRGINANAAMELSREKWAFRTSGTYRKHESYNGGDGHTVPFSQFEKLNLHSVLKYEPSAGDQLRFDFLLDEAFDVGYSALPMDVARASARIWSAEYRKSFNESRVEGIKLKAYYNTVYHLMDDSRRDSLYLLEGSGSADTVVMRMDMPGWSDTWGIYMKTDISLVRGGRLQLKLDDYLNFSGASMTMFMELRSNPGEPPMYAETWPDQYRNVTGFYAKYSKRLSDTWKLGVDARIDYSVTGVTSKTGWKQFTIFGYDINRPYHHLPLSLNLDLAAGPASSTDISGGMGYSERLPTNSEQFGFFLFNALDGYDYLGNPDIRMEKSLHMWTRIRYTRPTLRASLSADFSHVEDYILGVTDAGISQMNLYASGVKRYRNIEYARLLGMGLQVYWIPHSKLSVYSLSKYTHGRTAGNEALPLIPPLKNFTIVKYMGKRFSTQAEGEFSSAQNRISRQFGESPTPGYTVFHLRASRVLKIARLHIELSAGIENIFNSAFSEHLDWGDFLRPGRNIYLNMNILL